MYPRKPQMSAVATIKSQISEKLKPEVDLVTEEAMKLPGRETQNSRVCCKVVTTERLISVLLLMLLLCCVGGAEGQLSVCIYFQYVSMNLCIMVCDINRNNHGFLTFFSSFLFFLFFWVLKKEMLCN